MSMKRKYMKRLPDAPAKRHTFQRHNASDERKLRDQDEYHYSPDLYPEPDYDQPFCRSQVS